MSNLSEIQRYPYVRPENHNRVLFWKMRGWSNTGRKTFWYVTPDPEWDGIWGYRHGEFGLTANQADRDRALYGIQTLRLDAPVILWCEGEKDTETAWRNYRVPAVSHHGGACKATQAQAEHFRGYAGLVGVVADRDDPGYACAFRRAGLLRGMGVRADVVRAADDVTPDGVCPAGKFCYCDTICPPPSSVFKTDLTDHARARKTLGELEIVPEPELRAADERWKQERAAGAYYAPPLEDWEREMIKNSQLIKYGWDGIYNG